MEFSFNFSPLRNSGSRSTGQSFVLIHKIVRSLERSNYLIIKPTQLALWIIPGLCRVHNPRLLLPCNLPCWLTRRRENKPWISCQSHTKNRRKTKRQREGKRDATLPPTVCHPADCEEPFHPWNKYWTGGPREHQRGTLRATGLMIQGFQRRPRGFLPRTLCRVAARAGLREDIPVCQSGSPGPLPGCFSASQTLTVVAYSKY